MDSHAVFCNLLLLTYPGVCFGEELVLPDSIKGAVGDKVVITPTRIPNRPLLFIRWSFNSTTILNGPPSGIIILAPYRDRVSLDHSTYALELRNLVENDTGLYSLSIETESNSISGQTSLYVLVPVSEVTIKPIVTEVELNSTVSLICSASGSSLSFTWLNNSFKVTAGKRVQLTDKNRNLTITSVIRGDEGPYECEVSNNISKIRSLPVSLPINFNETETTSGKTLSAGVIAGIVIGVLLSLAGIAGLIVYFIKVKEMPNTNFKGNKPTQSGAAHNTDKDDSNYENMVCFKNKNTVPTVGGSNTRHNPHSNTEDIYENL